MRSQRRFLAAVAVLAAAVTALSGGNALANAADRTTVTYQADDSVLANPAGGFYHAAETHYRDASGKGWVPLSEATLRSWRAQGITQVFREDYLEYFGGANGAWNLTPDLLG